MRVRGIVESTAPPTERYDPGNPLADADGNVYAPNVNVIEEMTDMISASRAYQNNVEVMNTSKELMLATLKLGVLTAQPTNHIETSHVIRPARSARSTPAASTRATTSAPPTPRCRSRRRIFCSSSPRR